ncbi:NAD-dependent epimerase/dehydratase family protein [Chitinophaga nivalis]|uniref:NAD-dependent epimerase/dehydratase family protein n=1 Tax=Chitinophaga nivalis TaxID=2991709 RepID=A0ABT3IN96_9BACT|nr:NAD-dependent epimerase/dehydratase family protein [Chitinophaga nivalis]MCW3464861.1 NAD-dependent epimerase/dehydratase family protein [Chitinophaga nivalis]MCW3485448.1 NAD-dependent epimerase/dehydratase family protein [Chitinophaga nivalis]
MKIAITGATGYIGTVLTPLLLANGHQLQLLTRRPPAVAPLPAVTFVPGDLLDAAAIRQLVSGADAVIHLAAVISVSDQPDEQLFHTNTEGTRLLVTAAQQAGVKRFIHVSSVTAYNQVPCDEPLNEQRAAAPDTHYGYDRSKAVSQAIALAHNGNGMEVIVLAPTAVIGPYDQRPSLIGKAVISLYKGRIPALFPGGVDFVDVRDVAQAIVNALTMGTPGQAYLLGGAWHSLTALSKEIGIIKGKKSNLPVLPVWLIFGMLPLVKGLAAITGGAPYYTRQSVYNLLYSNKKIDHSNARTALQFQPRSLSVTLQDTIQWFKQTGKLS